MDRAIVLGLAKENSSKIIGNIKKHKVKIEFWTLEEFQNIIALLKKDDYYEHYIFISLWLLFMTGLRIGEASALQWKDIDFETGVLSVTKNLYYKSCNDYKFVEPKTKASVRQIVIDDDTLEQLQLWKLIQQKIIKTDFLLSYNGTPTNNHSLPRAIEKLSEMANIHRIKVHALRHPYVKPTLKIFYAKELQASLYTRTPDISTIRVWVYSSRVKSESNQAELIFFLHPTIFQ